MPPSRTGIPLDGCSTWMCWSRSRADGAGRIWACPPGAVWSAAEWERAAPPAWLHTVEELRQRTGAILRDFFARTDREMLAGQAARALMYEVCTTPKPGLVDRANCGSHRDMDLFTFLDSTAALLPYWRQAVSIGQETAALPPEETFLRLREAGVEAERAMLQATRGINTHKGMIFSMGCLLGPPAACGGRRPCRDAARLLEECARMSAGAVEDAFSALTPETARTFGARLYLETGLRGIRGEVVTASPPSC